MQYGRVAASNSRAWSISGLPEPGKSHESKGPEKGPGRDQQAAPSTGAKDSTVMEQCGVHSVSGPTDKGKDNGEVRMRRERHTPSRVQEEQHAEPTTWFPESKRQLDLPGLHVRRPETKGGKEEKPWQRGSRSKGWYGRGRCRQRRPGQPHAPG